jgi:hypothetical protein
MFYDVRCVSWPFTSRLHLASSTCNGASSNMRAHHKHKGLCNQSRNRVKWVIHVSAPEDNVALMPTGWPLRLARGRLSLVSLVFCLGRGPAAYATGVAHPHPNNDFVALSRMHTSGPVCPTRPPGLASLCPAPPQPWYAAPCAPLWREKQVCRHIYNTRVVANVDQS